MCGIVGILARGASVSPDVLENATRSLAHRGPDDSGTLILRAQKPEAIEVGLGNRRLAILDLSPLGHQPMQDPETGNWIVFNGEIYNFREVRAALQKEGTRFTSESDTEVLLKAYGRWGTSCLDRLRGMFAFAIWQPSAARLFLARDPFGVKPLYYHFSDRLLIFASELRTLLGTGLVPRQLDHAGLINYLTFGSIYDPNTLIENVSSLPAGHYLSWERGKVQTACYSDVLPAYKEGNSQAGVEARSAVLSDVHNLLLDSVRLHTVSDVPVGVFLSGGIDSSSLVALLTEIGVRPHTFSLVFGESSHNEAEFSREISRLYGSEHQEIAVSQRDVLNAIPSALQAMDQPTIDGINTYIVSSHVRNAGVKVALSGLGGDEMFAGYSSFRTVPRMERFRKFWRRVPRGVRGCAAAFPFSKDSDHARKLFTLLRLPDDIVDACFLYRMLFTPGQVRNLLHGENQSFWDRATAPLLNMSEHSHGLDSVNRVSYLESQGYMVNTLLRDSDVMGMAHGLEIRVPFVDRTLASYLFNVSGLCKTQSPTPKSLLVDGLRRKLPDSVVYRRKQGFALPFEHWLRDELRIKVEGALMNWRSDPLASMIDPVSVERIWNDFLASKTSWSRPWSLFVLSQWCRANL